MPCSIKTTPDGNLTIALGPGAAPEGKIRFTATVDWPVHLQAIQPADLLLAPGQRQTSIAKTPQVAQVLRCQGVLGLRGVSGDCQACWVECYRKRPAPLDAWDAKEMCAVCLAL